MNMQFSVLMTAATAAVLLLASPMAAQVSPSAKETTDLLITEGPALESAKDNGAIVRWTSNNPGGPDEHFGLVHYGTDPTKLSETAKSHIRLNPGHPYTVFRVRLDDLKPGTTYYYTVGAVGSDGSVDRMKSTVKQFTTPGEPRRVGQ